MTKLVYSWNFFQYVLVKLKNACHKDELECCGNISIMIGPIC